MSKKNKAPRAEKTDKAVKAPRGPIPAFKIRAAKKFAKVAKYTAWMTKAMGDAAVTDAVSSAVAILGAAVTGLADDFKPSRSGGPSSKKTLGVGDRVFLTEKKWLALNGLVPVSDVGEQVTITAIVGRQLEVQLASGKALIVALNMISRSAPKVADPTVESEVVVG